MESTLYIDGAPFGLPMRTRFFFYDNIFGNLIQLQWKLDVKEQYF